MHARHAIVLQELTAQLSPEDYESLPAPEQGRRYAAVVGRTPLAKFLHLARREKLTRDTLRDIWKNPREVQAGARLLGPTQTDDGMIERG